MLRSLTLPVPYRLTRLRLSKDLRRAAPGIPPSRADLGLVVTHSARRPNSLVDICVLGDKPLNRGRVDYARISAEQNRNLIHHSPHAWVFPNNERRRLLTVALRE